MSCADRDSDRSAARVNAIGNNRLHLILLPTEQCNFRCTYCYEDFAIGRMAAPVVTGVKAMIDRRAPSLDDLCIGWFGGEPLAAFDIVSDIGRHARDAAAAHGIDFSSNMTTNAYRLDGARLAACLDIGIDMFHVALDGDGATHDATRRLMSGKGSFDRIWANLLAARDGPGEFRMLLRLHYTTANWRAVEAFAGKVRETFGGDLRFGAYVHAIEPFGGPNDAEIPLLPPDVRATIERAIYAALGSTDHAPAAEGGVCYAACGNSFVVRANGGLAKCTIALRDAHNDIGRLLPDGTIAIDQTRFQRWVAPVIEGRWDDMACPLPAVAAEALEAEPA